ncbi:hypothetical protein [Thalassovita mediterranea]|jgi:energy-converting hydrogenase Eha subunit G|uniref:Uncharacterized protein n=1 Tax=Thalassovita mediterranea TaxID=340021 RepID=A0A0P1GS32_9RHOB|nr:hypothetical protein [Thalassovita mediterranea]MCG7572766.1 hypothetical protein [Phaeobacter sp. CNT1-3]CUH85369.1 hypothetical protein TM5383_02598 [Thalassovita mediterranea]SIS30363.1 hypothetical protein SAMN05421685_10318 [Thalassovita mediterranea]
MQKLIAILTVVSWSGFWSFGYIALTATNLTDQQILTATCLAGLGFLTGVGAYLALAKGQTINNTALRFQHAQLEG